MDLQHLSKNEKALLLDSVDAKAALQARRSFWAYRQYRDPTMKTGWFQREMAHALQQFWNDYKAGKKPMLAITTPPQHGKSRTLTEFVSWASGQDPNLRSIFASVVATLGERTNLAVQREFASERYQRVFPEFRFNEEGYRTTNTLIEFPGSLGQFRNTTIRGQIVGEGLDLGLIDDPIKSREDAMSELIREKTWSWFTDDFFTRFSEEAAMLFIMTRWHVDDPLGRMLEMREEFPNLKVLHFPALATEDEAYRKKGEALFPELKSKEFILARKAVQTTGNFEALYQGNPTIQGGELFPIEKFIKRKPAVAPEEIKRSVRYWDKAGTQDGGAYTAGVLMHELRNGTWCVADVYRKQVDVWNREQDIRRISHNDAAVLKKYVVWIEQEPGSGGKESAQRTISNLAGLTCRPDRPKGDKYLRAEPYAAQVQGGNIVLLDRPWTKAFINEHETFPNGKYKDQVDAAGAAFSKLAPNIFAQETALGGFRKVG